MALPKKHHFVLVHGGGHGSWCWVKIVPLLEKAGHHVTVVDLASAGDGPVMADDITSFQQYNQPLLDLFDAIPDGEKVVLVGHSIGGLSITGMSELFANKISVAVYFAALMPPPNANVLEALASGPELISPLEWKQNYKLEGGRPTSTEFTFELLKEYFYNKCSPEDLAYAADRVKRSPFFGNVVDIPVCTKENYGRVPRIYVVSLHDKVFRPAVAHQFAAQNPPNEVIEIDADHSPYFSSVEAIGKVLSDAAAKYDS